MAKNDTPWRKTVRRINGKQREVMVRRINDKEQIRIIDSSNPEHSFEEKEYESEYVKLDQPSFKANFIDSDILESYRLDDKPMWDNRVQFLDSKLPKDLKPYSESKKIINNPTEKDYSKLYTYENYESNIIRNIANRIEDESIDIKQFTPETQKKLKPFIQTDNPEIMKELSQIEDSPRKSQKMKEAALKEGYLKPKTPEEREIIKADKK